MSVASDLQPLMDAAENDDRRPVAFFSEEATGVVYREVPVIRAPQDPRPSIKTGPALLAQERDTGRAHWYKFEGAKTPVDGHVFPTTTEVETDA